MRLRSQIGRRLRERSLLLKPPPLLRAAEKGHPGPWKRAETEAVSAGDHAVKPGLAFSKACARLAFLFQRPPVPHAPMGVVRSAMVAFSMATRPAQLPGRSPKASPPAYPVLGSTDASRAKRWPPSPLRLSMMSPVDGQAKVSVKAFFLWLQASPGRGRIVATAAREESAAQGTTWVM